MTVEIINQTIRAMCDEVEVATPPTLNWKMMAEDELLYEATVCIFSSQMVFEVAVAAADRLREWRLLQPRGHFGSAEATAQRIVDSLKAPIAIADVEVGQRWVRPRFKNRMAFLLASTITEVYGRSLTIYELLKSANDAREARRTLALHVWGFGPKQASLFLRRVGYCTDLAVLDVHVLDYLDLARGLSLSRSKLGCLSFYEEVEDLFREVSDEFGYSMGCVDLATWLTMRVAKREGVL